MSCFGYRRELSKYEDIDEDELLASLSAEELAELEKELSDIDPDSNVPIGLRQRDQTDKTPTGTFSREALMKYWENETRRLLEDELGGASPKLDEEQEEECVTEGTSEGEEDKDDENEKEQKKNEKENEEEEEDENSDEEEDDEEKENNKAKPEPLMNSGPMTSRVENLTLLKPQRVEPMRLTPPPPPVDPNTSGNPIVVDDALQRVLRNDPELTEVNLNNIDDISQETLVRFAEALRSNTHVRTFSLANTRADDPVALAIAKMLKQNSSIISLNIESNYVSGKGVMALVQALPGNNTLTELRFHNQRHMCGGQVEMEMVKILRENYTLIKLGYQFNLPGPRMSMTGILTRNQDRQRQKRLQEQKQQQQNQQGAQEGAVNRRTTRGTPSSSPYSSPRASPWSSPKLPRNDLKKTVKTKGKKGKKGKAGNDETNSILKELKNALRPVSGERRGEEGSRPSTPMRSAHDQLMESIRNSGMRNLRRVEVPRYLR
uniref:Leiomodin-2 n=1 Tax=Amphilophus citrinellus TaxID=61819 RepID=A0A3Q0SKV5_AMPCI